jgi:RNA polymerase sigma-70 factor (ECF subfamily)
MPLSEYLGETQRPFNDHYFDLDIPGEYGHNKASAFPPVAELESDYAINQQELKRVLDQCIRKLPTTLSNVFLMKYLTGESAGFICSKFNISQANYWVILHRSKLLLRTCISRIWLS